MTYEHPRARYLREVIATTRYLGFKRHILAEKLETFLAIYAEHGYFSLAKLGPDLTRWLREVRVKREHRRASAELILIVTELKLDQLIRGPRRPNGKAVQWARTRQKLRQELELMVPDDFVRNRGEDLPDSVWWWWLGEWKRHADKPEPGAPPPKLQKFIELTLRMRDEGLLNDLQLDYVDVLTQPAERPKLAAHA